MLEVAISVSLERLLTLRLLFDVIPMVFGTVIVAVFVLIIAYAAIYDFVAKMKGKKK